MNNSSRLEFLKYQKNRLVDIWKSKRYPDEETKILVKIMDIDEEIHDEIESLKKKKQRTWAV